MLGVSDYWWVGDRWFSYFVVLRWAEAFFEGDGEPVEWWVLSLRPSCPAFPGRVKRPGHEIQACQGGLVVGEASLGVHGSPVAGVQGFDGVGRADDLADL